MIRRRFIVSLEVLETLLKDQRRGLQALGIDARGLIEYSLHLATVSDYPTLIGHLSKDLGEHLNDYPLEPREFQRVLHRCLDFIQQAAALLVPFLTDAIGYFDHTVRLEQFLGADAVFSVEVSEYETIL